MYITTLKTAYLIYYNSAQQHNIYTVWFLLGTPSTLYTVAAELQLQNYS